MLGVVNKCRHVIGGSGEVVIELVATLTATKFIQNLENIFGLVNLGSHWGTLRTASFGDFLFPKGSRKIEPQVKFHFQKLFLGKIGSKNDFQKTCKMSSTGSRQVLEPVEPIFQNVG